MKPLLISTSDRGGSGMAAYRVHRGLQQSAIPSQMLVQTKLSDDPDVLESDDNYDKAIAKLRINERVNALPLQRYRQRDRAIFSTQWFPDTIAAKVKQINPDIVNLHWICKGFVRIETLAQFNCPVVWTFHDMWAFTGGCHYSGECDRYVGSCGACPQLNSSRENDLSRWVWRRKTKAWKNLNLTVVTPSQWMAKCARSSALFQNTPVEVIPNGLNTDIYKPLDRRIARSRLNLPEDKQLILFGARDAGDPRKGFPLLQSALKHLEKSGWHDRLELAIFGTAKSLQQFDLGFKYHLLGRLNDEISLALLYAAADVFVASSLQDNLPNTVVEALACGTPSVAFDIGGLPDIIDHQDNGYLARPYKSEDLARGIAWVLEDPQRHQHLRDRARQKAEKEFTMAVQAKRYADLFTRLVR